MLDVAALVGQILDAKYRLEQLLGQGGMGAVFRATHLGTDRVVALKLIAPGLMDRQDFVARFQREARATGRLRHPNIVDLTDFGFTELQGQSLAYLVMEYLEGETLAQALVRNPTPPLPFITDLAQQVCSALQEAHDHGVVHRDLKPDNLWLEPNHRGGHTVKILDFGLAKIYDPRTRADGLPGLPVADLATRAMAASEVLTRALLPGAGGPMMTEVGTALGTPAYMSPEQCRGVALDHRSDLYSLGVILYQMLSGRTPFQGNSLHLINQHIQSDAPPLGELRPGLPAGLAELVMECLSKDPAKRPETAEILGNACEAHAQTPLRQLQQTMNVLMERWPEIWPLVRLHAVGIPLWFVACGGAAYFTEVPMTSTEKIQWFGPALSVALFWHLYALGTLKGLLAPVVLVHTLLPLQPLSGDWVARFREQARPMRRLVLRNLAILLGTALPVLAMFTLTERMPAQGLRGPALVLTVLAVTAFTWGIVGLLLLLGHRQGGSVAGATPCAMLVEGIPLREASARMVALRKKIVARHLPAMQAGESHLSSVCLVLLMFLFLPAQDLLIGELAPGTVLRTVSFTSFAFAVFAPLILLLAVADAIATNLVYFRLRKIARESLREAYAALRSRLEAPARPL